MADDLKVTVTVKRAGNEYEATITAKTPYSTESFGGRADSVLGALESAVSEVDNTKRPGSRGRMPNRFSVAIDLGIGRKAVSRVATKKRSGSN